MQILKANPSSPRIQDLNKITSALAAGEIVVLPTETVYTFAVDATNELAVEAIYEIKGRDFKKPLHVVVSNLKMAEKYVKVSEATRKLADRFLPGPLTLILPKKKGLLPELLTAGLPTLGIRIPSLPLNQLVAEKLGKPYTTTSANPSGGINPYSVDEVLNQITKMKKKIMSLVVDVGRLPNLPPSTLLDLTSDPPKILRQGPITKEQIEKVLGPVIQV